MSASVRSSNREVQRLLADTLKSLDCSEAGIKIHITASGGEASFFDENGDYIDAARALALGCVTAFEQGEDVALPYEAPRAMDFIASGYKLRVLRYLSCPADGADKPARTLAATQPWVRDGLQNALRILAYLKLHNMKLCDFAAKLPPFALAVKAVSVAGGPGNLLKKLSSVGGRQEGPHEGVLLAEGTGRVLLSPLKRGAGLRIMAEAASMEAADELCAEFEKRLQNNERLDIKDNNR
jgi:mannose-1-phosphate guanylyltransferase/phosphomannomutase